MLDSLPMRECQPDIEGGWVGDQGGGVATAVMNKYSIDTVATH